MTTRIFCTCCRGTAAVSGTHSFVAVKNCRNGTYVETVTSTPRIGGRKLDLIRVWDEDKRAYVPLLAA